ncbi:hypothetical protein DAEQUDRAFT_754164 [Daedalea quercina L-15889]|uniref:Uncharacterized protein n=1 Tax=Daedalea quercina L-15889 TaxID=1314783 RepID=A0A165U147_9APHY|nr:hypothetical protein DAEQUDRAFT_754164 [Daedalea quercina L-15889]
MPGPPIRAWRSSEVNSEGAQPKTASKPVGLLRDGSILIKNCINIEGHDTPSVSSWIGKIVGREDVALVVILRGAGAVFYCMTNMLRTIIDLKTDSYMAHAQRVQHGPRAWRLVRWRELARRDEGLQLRRRQCIPLSPHVDLLPISLSADIGGGAEGVVFIAGPIVRSAHDVKLFMKAIMSAQPWLDDKAYRAVNPAAYRWDEEAARGICDEWRNLQPPWRSRRLSAPPPSDRRRLYIVLFPPHAIVVVYATRHVKLIEAEPQTFAAAWDTFNSTLKMNESRSNFSEGIVFGFFQSSSLAPTTLISKFLGIACVIASLFSIICSKANTVYLPRASDAWGGLAWVDETTYHEEDTVTSPVVAFSTNTAESEGFHNSTPQVGALWQPDH